MKFRKKVWGEIEEKLIENYVKAPKVIPSINLVYFFNITDLIDINHHLFTEISCLDVYLWIDASLSKLERVNL